MTINRRQILGYGFGAGIAALGLGALAGCGEDAKSYVKPNSKRVADVERKRGGGAERRFSLTASADHVDLGGVTAPTWTYGGEIPGKELRLTAGEVLVAELLNELPAATSVHWHGVALRNDADGIPDVTQSPVASRKSYSYRFTASHPGTYWFHPHSGVQLDRGLYAPLIVEDPDEPGRYDDEWTVVLDDWLDGVTGTPDEVLEELSKGMGGGMHGGHGDSGSDGDSGASDGSGSDDGDMPGMDHGGHGGAAPTPSGSPSAGGGHMMSGTASDLLGGDAGDVRYPHFLVNGRVASAPASYRGKPGQRIRIRLINAGGDTAFRVALGGHRMTVTHTDGFPVEPVDTDALLIGMGERYDVLVTLADGVFPLVAVAEGKKASALALVRTGRGAAPDAAVRPRELSGKIVGYAELTPAEAARLKARKPDRTVRLRLTGGMKRYDWGINGRRYDPNQIEPVREGERVRLILENRTTMWHPMHLHGHTFAVADSGVRKDTAIVLPQQTLTTEFEADNPGLWMIHCHNIYHAESGMMTTLGYEA